MNVPTSSPTAWRRWLAIELRRLRHEAGMSMQQVANLLRCSSPKVSYLEKAQRPVGAHDLEVLLEAYGVPESEHDAYERARRDSRKKGWWERYQEATLPALYIGLEQGASRLRSYEPQVVNGLLQTADYAAEVNRRDPVARSSEHVDRLVQLRLTRQVVLDRDPDPLALWAILDEAVLRRQVAGPGVMAEQLFHIAERAGQPNITVQVLPFAAGAHGSTDGGYSILTFPWPTDPGVVYVDGWAGAHYHDDFEDIEKYSLAFQQLCALALPPDESVEFLHAVAQDYARAAPPEPRVRPVADLDVQRQL